MTQKNFNAKKMLMSTLAAVVFSFVFTTNADARYHYPKTRTASTSINIQEEQQKEQKTDIFASILNFFMRAK